MAQINKTSLTVGQSVTGQDLTVPVFTVTGDLDGPNVYIQANMHGAEIQGNAVIFQLLNQLASLEIRGKITLVPHANPLGGNQKSGEYTMGRFDPLTGENYNRMYYNNMDFIPEFVEQNIDVEDSVVRQRFKAILRQQLAEALDSPFGLKSGQQISYALQQMAVEADYVLDLHTGPNSSHHLYVAEYFLDAAQYFNIPHVLVIPNGFDGALDEACFVPWWTLSDAFAAKGRVFAAHTEAYTVELGSQESISLAQAEQDTQSLLSYLCHKEMFAEAQFTPAKMTRYGCYLKDFKTIYSPHGGLAEYHGVHGEILPAGAPLANLLRMDRYTCDGLGQQNALTTVSLPQAVIPILNCASGSVQQGTELYKVFYNFFELS
ncbi:MAG: putative deacylase [Phenylobacterium sp.]|jgi:predicted deacylase